MTWPASDVTRTNADAGTDNPATFRSDVLDLIDKFNQLRNHVTGFVQGLLSAANAVAARGTLGAAASGANSDITDLTALASLPTALTPLGVGQTWQDLSGSRTLGTAYTNSTGRPILVSVTGVSASGNFGMAGYVGAVLAGYGSNYNTTASTIGFCVTLLVPSGSSYNVNALGAGPTAYVWSELR